MHADEAWPLTADERSKRLKCPGVGRDKDNLSALQFYFSRRVTDAEMRFLHEVVERAVAMFPLDDKPH